MSTKFEHLSAYEADMRTRVIDIDYTTSIVNYLTAINNLRKQCGKKAIRVFMDGDQVCAVYDDFDNLQASECGFGNTINEAVKELEQGVMLI